VSPHQTPNFSIYNPVAENLATLQSIKMDDFEEAQEYNKVNKRQTIDGIAMLNRLAPKPGIKVLDLGCGTGNITKEMAKRVYPGKVTGIDPDPSRIQTAASKHASDNVNYAEGSTKNIPGEDYDLVFSNYVLHWVLDNEAVFGPIASKLKPGGHFVFIVLDIITKELVEKHLGWASEDFQKEFLSRLKGLSKNDVLRLADENGFEVEYVHKGDYALEFDSVDEYIQHYLIHGGITRDKFNEENIKKFYGSEKVNMNIDTVEAILRKK